MEIGLTAALYGTVIPLMRATPLIPYFGEEGLEEDQQIVNDLRGRMGISKEVQVRRTPVKGIFEYAAFGAFLLPFTQSFLIPQRSEDWPLEEGAKFFIYAHEIAHLERNDVLKTTLILTITFVVVAILFSLVVLIDMALTLGLIAGIVAMIIYSRYSEKKADLRACEVATDDEIIEGALFFEQMRVEKLDSYRECKRLGLLIAVLMSENGDDPYDLFHPSLSERVTYIRNTIRDPRKKYEFDHRREELYQRTFPLLEVI